jgi:amino acid permease
MAQEILNVILVYSVWSNTSCKMYGADRALLACMLVQTGNDFLDFHSLAK